MIAVWLAPLALATNPALDPSGCGVAPLGSSAPSLAAGLAPSPGVDAALAWPEPGCGARHHEVISWAGAAGDRAVGPGAGLPLLATAAGGGGGGKGRGSGVSAAEWDRIRARRNANSWGVALGAINIGMGLGGGLFTLLLAAPDVGVDRDLVTIGAVTSVVLLAEGLPITILASQRHAIRSRQLSALGPRPD